MVPLGDSPGNSLETLGYSLGNPLGVLLGDTVGDPVEDPFLCFCLGGPLGYSGSILGRLGDALTDFIIRPKTVQG